MKTLTPLYDKVLIKKAAEEDKTAGGIIIPESASDMGAQLKIATVVSVGKGRKTNGHDLIPLQVKSGDQILYNKHAGLPFDSDHLILREDEIVGIVQ